MLVEAQLAGQGRPWSPARPSGSWLQLKPCWHWEFIVPDACGRRRYHVGDTLEKVVETLQQDLESKAHRIVNPQEADAEVQELPWMNDSQLPCAILIC